MEKQTIDTILLAGDGSGSRKIDGKNKCFLEIDQLPLLVHVVRAIEQVERIDKICIVGPKVPIEKLLNKYATEIQQNKPIEVIEQSEDLYSNCLAAFTHLIPGYVDGAEDTDSSIREKAVLLIPSDIPFLTSREVDEFLDNASKEQLDYCVGMTEEQYLSRFDATGNKPGFSMNYLHLREGSFRLNNLHLIKPFKVLNRKYLEQLYQRRHQKNLMNILSTFYDFSITQKMGIAPVLLFVWMEFSVLLRHMGLNTLANLSRRWSAQASLTKYACRLLQTRVGIVHTTVGGCAADIDSEEDYRAVKARYQEWRSLLD